MLQNSQYFATIAANKLVMMPTIYLAEKGFSTIVDIKNKKTNRLKIIDELMVEFWKSKFCLKLKKIAQQVEVLSSSN